MVATVAWDFDDTLTCSSKALLSDLSLVLNVPRPVLNKVLANKLPLSVSGLHAQLRSAGLVDFNEEDFRRLLNEQEEWERELSVEVIDVVSYLYSKGVVNLIVSSERPKRIEDSLHGGGARHLFYAVVGGLNKSAPSDAATEVWKVVRPRGLELKALVGDSDFDAGLASEMNLTFVHFAFDRKGDLLARILDCI